MRLAQHPKPIDIDPVLIAEQCKVLADSAACNMSICMAPQAF